MSERLAVQPALETHDLQSHGGGDFATGAFDHLKFLEALLEILGRKIFLLPKSHQLRQVFDGGTANLQVRCSHREGELAPGRLLVKSLINVLPASCRQMGASI